MAMVVSFAPTKPSWRAWVGGTAGSRDGGKYRGRGSVTGLGKMSGRRKQKTTVTELTGGTVVHKDGKAGHCGEEGEGGHCGAKD